MPDLTQKSEPELFLNLLLCGLRVRDEKMNAVAAEIFIRQGNRPAPRLVLEAAREGNNPAYRVRVLAVLQRIAAGAGLAITDLTDLSGLLVSKNSTVREAAQHFFESSAGGKRVPEPEQRPRTSRRITGCTPGRRDRPA